MIHPQTENRNRKSRMSLGVIDRNRVSLRGRKSTTKGNIYDSPAIQTPDFKQKSERKSIALHKIDSF